MVEGRCTPLMLLFMVMFADKLLITANWSTVSNRDGQDVALAKGDAWAEPRWQPYKKHLPPSSRTKKWSQLVRETGQGRNPAFYHQDLLGQIEELEMTCRREGHVLGERGPIRSYWLEFGHVIGASRG